MKKPRLQDDAFLADVSAAREVVNPDVASPLHLWWLGQSGFLVQWKDHYVLLDPYLSDSLTRKYAGTDKPHVRICERVVAPERLGFVDLVTSSHQHTDHLDPDTLRPLAQNSPYLRLICPESIRAVAAERSGLPNERIIGLDADEWVIQEFRGSREDTRPLPEGGVRIQAVAAAHEEIERDADGRCLYLGYIIQVGPFCIYHSGDTVRHEGLVKSLEGFTIDVALLPINGRKPERRVAGNLDGIEAAQLANELRAGLVVPCHYDLFEFNTASPDDFERECKRLGQPCHIMELGARLSLPPRTTDSPAP